MTIDISKKDKAEVLAALYNASHPQGLGILHYDPTPMSAHEAREFLAQTTYFDYLKGSSEDFPPCRLYLKPLLP